jgi:hypothetical protein
MERTKLTTIGYFLLLGCCTILAQEYLLPWPGKTPRSSFPPSGTSPSGTESALKQPYIGKAGERGPITVWVVDGSFVRTNVDEEFTNFGQHHVFDFIPNNEFWLDREAVEDEQQFYTAHLVVEFSLMERGASYDTALEAADRAELTERRKTTDLKTLAGDNELPDPGKAHAYLWKKLESGTEVWVVNGRLVRSGFDVDFTEGGHGFVYEFIPRREVWIDNDVIESERAYILLHELHERALMEQGWTYDKAHADASNLESYCRHHPDELHLLLAKEGWE